MFHNRKLTFIVRNKPFLNFDQLPQTIYKNTFIYLKKNCHDLSPHDEIDHKSVEKNGPKYSEVPGRGEIS